MPSPNLLLHPLTLYFLQKSYTIYALAFTPSLPTRLSFLVLILACLYASYATYLDKLPRGVVASIVSGTTFADVLQYLDLVVLGGWGFDDDGAPAAVVDGQTRYPADANAEADVTMKADGTMKAEAASVDSSSSLLSSVYQRLQYGCFMSTAPRLIGTKYQVKNVPPYKISNHAYIPSRTSFLLRKALTVCVCYLLLDLATSSTKPAENPISYSSDKIPFLSRLGDVDGDEILKKLVEGVGYWTASYCTMQCYMGAWAFLCVACGSDPEYWRPNFGSLSEGYTLRRFWGNFWHQHLRRSLTSVSSFLSESVLGMPKHTLFACYTNLLLAFLLSGLLHLFTEVAAHGGGSPSSNLSFHESQCVRFFFTQAIGIIFEDGVQEVANRFGILRDGNAAWWTKAVGWIWVVAFLGWSTPALMYPAARLNTGTGKDVLLPFSFVQVFRPQGAR